MKLLYDFIFVVGFVIICLYIIVLSKSKVKNISKNVLVSLFVLALFVLLESYASIHKLRILHLISFLPAHNIKLLVGPLILIYIKSLFYDKKKLFVNNLKFFIPCCIFFVFLSIPTLVNKITTVHFKFFGDISSHYNGYVRIISDIVLLTFVYFNFKVLFKVNKASKNNFSYEIEDHLLWIKYLLISIFSIICLDIFFASSQLLFGLFPFRTQNIVIVFLVICLFVLAYYGTRQSKILIPYFLLEDNRTKREQVTTSPSLEGEFNKLNAKLEEITKEKKPYLNPELTLDSLAKQINTTNKKLSKLLNQHLKTTFYDYINKYRIEAFKTKIKSPEFESLTIEGLAYECGFKSKASFYRIFKKETGMSPTEYKKNVK